MKEQDVQALENAARLIISVLERAHLDEEQQEERHKKFAVVDSLTTNREFWQRGGKLAPMGDVGERDALLQEKEKPAEGREDKGSFYITTEEIKKMSKTIKGKFYTQGFAVCWRKRPSGKNSYTYQVRFQRDGYNIQFHEKVKDNLKPRFLAELQKRILEKQEEGYGVPSAFDRFARYYFERFRKIKVSKKTYDGDLGRLEKHIIPFFGDKRLKAITPSDCQRLLADILAEGKGKTADEVYCLMNGIFTCAIKHHIIQYNPLDIVVHIKHQREHGSALTKTEERLLLSTYRGTMYEIPFAVALYTGMRPNEYESARIEGGLIVCINSKRKNRKVEYKRIAISPMLEPYLANVESLTFPVPGTMREKIKAVLPNHKLYDLRTTFNTRCKECGVAEPARMEYMGHSLGELGNAYTDLSDEFLLLEGKKLKY